MSKGPCETRIMTLILGWLVDLEKRGHRCHFWRANTGMARTKGGGAVKFGENGQADIIGVVCGKFVAIEVKTDIGRVSSDQDKWGGSIASAGGTYIVARCLEDALEPVVAMLEAGRE